MAKLLRQFIKTISFYCQGKGSPWRLILIWYFLLNIVSLSIGSILLFLAIYFSESQWVIIQFFSVIIMAVLVCLGGIITFIYPLIFIYALWKCAFNVRWKPLGFILGFLTFPFLIAHSFLGNVYFAGSAMMLFGAFDTTKKIVNAIILMINPIS